MATKTETLPSNNKDQRRHAYRLHQQDHGTRGHFNRRSYYGYDLVEAPKHVIKAHEQDPEMQAAKSAFRPGDLDSLLGKTIQIEQISHEHENVSSSRTTETNGRPVVAESVEDKMRDDVVAEWEAKLDDLEEIGESVGPNHFAEDSAQFLGQLRNSRSVPRADYYEGRDVYNDDQEDFVLDGFHVTDRP